MRFLKLKSLIISVFLVLLLFASIGLSATRGTTRINGVVTTVGPVTTEKSKKVQYLKITDALGSDHSVKLCLKGCPASEQTFFRAQDIFVGANLSITGRLSSINLFLAKNINDRSIDGYIQGTIIRVTRFKNLKTNQILKWIYIQEKTFGNKYRIRKITICKTNCQNLFSTIQTTDFNTKTVFKESALQKGTHVVVVGALASDSSFTALSISKGKKKAAKPPKTNTPSSNSDTFCWTNNTCAISLTWDPVTTSEDGAPLHNSPRYKIYWGTSSGNYTHSADAGTEINSSISQLGAGTFFFVARSYITENSNIVESQNSNEVSKRWGP